jgi:hypothetical protein
MRSQRDDKSVRRKKPVEHEAPQADSADGAISGDDSDAQRVLKKRDAVAEEKLD